MGRLASRIIFVASLFLILPLFLFMVFMYFHEYEVKTRDAKLILLAVAQEKTALIEQEIASHKASFKAIGRGADPIFFEKVESCSAKECAFLVKRAKPIGDDVLLVSNKWRLTLITELPDKGYVTATIDVPKIVEKVKGVPNVSVYLLDEKKDVIAGSLGDEGMQFQEDHIWAIEPIGAGGYRLLFDIPKTVSYGDYFLRVAILVLLVLVVGGSAVFFLVRRINRPFHRLISVMRQVGQGDLEARYHQDSMGFEINLVGHIFNSMIGSVKSNSEKERELLLGQEVQHSLLPKHVPNFPELDIATYYDSAKEVGGDFYDILDLDNGKCLIVMADASGKGIFACLYALITRTLIHAYTEKPLADIVTQVNEKLMLDTGSSGAFVTAWFALFDPKTRELEYVSCGHNPPLIKKSSGCVVTLEITSMALGVSLFSAEVRKCRLEKGDMLIVYTDGIVEAHNINNTLFGQERLEKALVGASSAEMRDSIVASVADFAQNAPQHDDMALLIIR